MFDELKSRLPSFQTRLSETIGCMAQPLQSDPLESEEIQERRRLGEEAAKLAQQAHQSDPVNFSKSSLRHRARELWAKAKLHEILPSAHQLRSPMLQPEVDPFPFGRANQVRIADGMANRRAGLFRQQHHYPLDLVDDLQSGRLLLYAPDENLFDGAAQVQSKGFFTVDNIPPWDTWVCFFEQYLVSWVPPALLELADAGVDLNPEQCSLWAPDTGLPNA